MWKRSILVWLLLHLFVCCASCVNCVGELLSVALIRPVLLCSEWTLKVCQDQQWHMVTWRAFDGANNQWMVCDTVRLVPLSVLAELPPASPPSSPSPSPCPPPPSMRQIIEIYDMATIRQNILSQPIENVNFSFSDLVQIISILFTEELAQPSQLLHRARPDFKIKVQISKQTKKNKLDIVQCGKI